MADVAQLGKAFKQIHPEYADVADEALGRAVKSKYPGSYDDVQDPQKAQLAKNDQIIQGLTDRSPSDAGFTPTLLHDIKQAPSALMDFLSGHPMQDMFNSVGDQARAVREAKARNDYSSAIGHTLAGILTPLGGSQAAMAGEEGGGGQPRQGAAHALEVLAPYYTHAATEYGQSPITQGPNRFVKPWSPSSALNMVLPSKIKALINLLSGEDELKPAGALRRLELRSPLNFGDTFDRSPIWEGQDPIGSRTLPTVDPLPPESGAFPSGRIPGKGIPKVKPQPAPRTPVWEGMSPVGQRELPKVEPIIPASGAFPSGRVPGAGEPRAPFTPEVRPRTPIWKGMPDADSGVATPDPIGPVAFPSGRVPGAGIPKPPAPPPAAQPATSPVQPQGPIQTPAPTPVQPIGESMPQNTVMGGVEAHRYAHAQAQAAELPGSPAGTRAGAHDALTAIAKAKYGKNAWHELAPAQMQEIGDWLLDINMQKAQRQGIPPVK